MDDASFESWSEKLTQLRQARQKLVDQRLKDEAVSFGPADFFSIATKSLENIMDTWFDFEKGSWEANPSDDPSVIEAIRAEMESILDFETEAIDRDKAMVLSHITWDDGATQKAEPSFHTFIDELRNKFQLKIKSLSGGSRKREVFSPMPDPSVQMRHSGGGSTRGSGVSMMLMFALGLLLGAGPAVYFWDASNKAEKKFEDDRKKLLEAERALQDELALLHENFEKLAKGKSKNIPMLEAEINAQRAVFIQKRQRVEAGFQQEKERLFRKVPAGDRQDSMLTEMTSDRDIQIAELKKRETAAVEPLAKQVQILKDLLAH